MGDWDMDHVSVRRTIEEQGFKVRHRYGQKRAKARAQGHVGGVRVKVKCSDGRGETTEGGEYLVRPCGFIDRY